MTAAQIVTARSTVASRITALVQHPKMRTVTTQAQLDARLIGLGFSRTCGRCAGSGNYGPQCVDSGRCFGCAGRGTLPPKLTKALEVEVRAAVERGDLDRYVAKRLEISAARKAVKGAFDAVAASYKDTAWCQYFYGPNGSGKVTNPGYPVAWSLVHMTKPARDAAFTLDCEVRAGRGGSGAVTELLAACKAYAEAHAQLDRAHALCLARGLYEQATREHLAAKAISSAAERENTRKWAAVAASVWAECEVQP